MTRTVTTRDTSRLLEDGLNPRTLDARRAVLVNGPLMAERAKTNYLTFLVEKCGAKKVAKHDFVPPISFEEWNKTASLERHLNPTTEHTLTPEEVEEQSIVTLKEVERRGIKRALRIKGGNVTQAAKALGIYRNTLRRKMRHL